MNAVRKCLVWDLDNTLWDGVCLEGDVRVRPEVVPAITELDRRGILQSIASRGDADLAMQTLEQNGLAKFFLAPQINWLPKSQSIIRISKELRLSCDAIAFIDDDRFEREQVSYMLPGVLTLDARFANELPGLADFSPADITPEARDRRRLYQTELEATRAEAGFASREDFLASCNMKLTVRPMAEKDIPRVLELMTRTHQLNTTGLTLGGSDMEQIFHDTSDEPRVTVAELRDRFGGYGIIGAAIAESARPVWRLTSFAVSCRVMGRGIERAFLASLVRATYARGYTHSEAAYRDTGRNRMMRALYQMMGFRMGGHAADPETLLFRARIEEVPEVPRWVEVA
jgi:FkbH-like protein